MNCQKCNKELDEHQTFYMIIVIQSGIDDDTKTIYQPDSYPCCKECLADILE